MNEAEIYKAAYLQAEDEATEARCKKPSVLPGLLCFVAGLIFAFLIWYLV